MIELHHGDCLDVLRGLAPASVDALVTHPTVKPIALMRYLCRLITPPGGVVLDPFAGSGSTGVAAKAEGFGFIGIEREAEYVRIAQKRLGVDALAPRRSEEAARPRVPPFAMCLPELVAAGKWLASELAGVRR